MIRAATITRQLLWHVQVRDRFQCRWRFRLLWQIISAFYWRVESKKRQNMWPPGVCWVSILTQGTCVCLFSRIALPTLLQRTVSTLRWLSWLPLVTGLGITTDPTLQIFSRSLTTRLLAPLRVYFTRGLTRGTHRAAWAPTPLSDYHPSPSCPRTSRAPSALTTNCPSPLRRTLPTPMTSPRWRCYLAPCSPCSPPALPPTSPPSVTQPQLPSRPLCQVLSRDPPALCTSSRDSCLQTLERIFHGGACSRGTT